MKLMDESSQINFSFEVNADDTYEEYQIDIIPNFNSQIPNTKFHAYFHSEEDEDIDW